MALKPIIQIAAGTDRGCVRQNNEDAYRYLADGNDFWAVVADGCGGEAAGEVASRMAVEVFADEIAKHRDSRRDVSFILRDAVVKANRAIIEESKVDGKDGMGTTFSGFYIRGREVFTVHAGDSRIYRKRSGVFEQLTVDHTWVQEQVDRGRLSPEEAENHPRGSVLIKALGIPDFGSPDIDFLEGQENDVLLISSDGLHRVITLPEISEMMELPAEKAVSDLISLSLERGAPDNVTVIMARIEKFQRIEEGTLDNVPPVE